MSDPIDLTAVHADNRVNHLIFSPALERRRNSASTSTGVLHLSAGIDEAGRGPVLGPMVYAIFIADDDSKLRSLGCDDSKALTADRRSSIFARLAAESLFIAKVISPQYLSREMQRTHPVSLNAISHDAAIELIDLAVKRLDRVESVFVDTVGPPEKYERKLADRFPAIDIKVRKKADSLFPVVSAASIVAKVLRDQILNNWLFEIPFESVGANANCTADEASDPEASNLSAATNEDEKETTTTTSYGSGYPADPKTKRFLRDNCEPVFGYSRIVRFSWSTTQKLLAERGARVIKWPDDMPEDQSWAAEQARARGPMDAFVSSGTGSKAKWRDADFFKSNQLQSYEWDF